MKKVIILCIVLLTCTSVYSPGRELDVFKPKKADFLISYKYIMSHEGWYALVENDYGLETYVGISRKYSPKWHGWRLIDRYKWQHGGKIEWNTHIPDKLLDHYVLDFYISLWVENEFYDLNDQDIANHVMDTYLNGVIGGVRIIKRSLKDIGWKITINDEIDSTTIYCLNKSNKHIYLKTLEKRRFAFYNNIVKRDTSQRKFLYSWLSRSKI